jgi:transcriptional regulator with GAF, ATPase, and Fis domain
VAPLDLPVPFLGLGSEAQLRSLADASPYGLFTTDAAGHITFWSDGAQRITGYRPEEAVGKACSLLAGDGLHGCACAAGPVHCGLAAAGKTTKCCSIRTRDGRQLRIIKHAVPLLGPGGAPVGALETFAEVSEVVAFPSGAGAPAQPEVRQGDFCGMTGRHPDMRELYRMIELVARSDATVLILGESGTGKELVARAVHRMGPRAAGPFVRLPCAALEGDLADASGGAGRQAPALPDASGGTLLLDEIGDLTPAAQARLLHVLEERSAPRHGPGQPVGREPRILCTTHRDLRQEVTEGRFRADLYFRLAVFPLRVPPLRNRADDVPLLALALLEPRGTGARLSPEALAALRRRPWPGNVRELHNVVEFAALRAGDGEIRPEHLPEDPGGGPDARARDERAETLDALLRTNWSRARAAAALGISRVTLWKRMRRHGLAPPGGAPAPE